MIMFGLEFSLNFQFLCNGLSLMLALEFCHITFNDQCYVMMSDFLDL